MSETMATNTNPQGGHAGQSGKKAQNDMNSAVQQGAQAVQNETNAAGETIRQGAGSMADAMRRDGHATANVIQHGADIESEAVRRSAEAFTESQREFMQRATQRFEEVSRKVVDAAQGNSEKVRTLMALPSAAQGGLQEMQQSMTSLVEGVLRTNLRATQELFQLANPSAYIELQQRFVHEYLDALTHGVATLVRATRRTADETLRPLERQIEERRLQAAE